MKAFTYNFNPNIMSRTLQIWMPGYKLKQVADIIHERVPRSNKRNFAKYHHFENVNSRHALVIHDHHDGHDHMLHTKVLTEKQAAKRLFKPELEKELINPIDGQEFYYNLLHETYEDIGPSYFYDVVKKLMKNLPAPSKTRPAQKLKQKKEKQSMEVFLQKTIKPHVKYENTTTSTKNGKRKNGVKVAKKTITREIISEQIERDVTLCGYFVPELGLLKIGTAVRNPEYDEFNPEMGRQIALDKAKKNPTFAGKFCLDCDCEYSERTEAARLSLQHLNKHQMVKTLLYEVAKDMEKDFGKYVAHYTTGE